MKDYFISNLKYMRVQRKLSQNKLGQLIGVNSSTIKRWEEETMSPSIDKVESVCNFFKIPIQIFLTIDLANTPIEEISKAEFEELARQWIKTSNKTSEEKQKFLRELGRLIDEEGGE